MTYFIQAIRAEILKNRHSPINYVPFLAMTLAPLFGSVFMLLMMGDGYEGLSGAFKAKAVLLSFEANWPSFLSLLTQAIGIGGIIIFGFVAAWLFGREYSDDTAKDLMALPVSRTALLNAKFVYYIFWCLALALFNLLIGMLCAALLGLPGWSTALLMETLRIYLNTTLMIIVLNTPVAFIAIWGKGYLPPLAVMILMLILAQILGVMGIGAYFPWTVPGLYSGSGGADMKAQLTLVSYLLIVMTGIIGYIATILYWKMADQTK